MKTLFTSIVIIVLISSFSYANPWFEANRRCKSRWPDDQKMRDYCIKEQTDAYNSMPRTTSAIEDRCDLKWGTDWRMKKHCIERENEKSDGFEIQRRPNTNASTVSNDPGGDSSALIGSALRETGPPKFIFKDGKQHIVYCPRCNSGTSYDKSLSGKKTKCPRCNDILVFP